MTLSTTSPGDEREELSSKQIEAGWHKTFSTSNPFCPCDLKSFTKAVRWAERALSSSTVQQVGADVLDAARYRWLRAQHEGQEELSYDAEGLPIPVGPTALAFTVFRPVDGSLDPVGCIPGELDAAIDAAITKATGDQQ